MSKYLRVSYVDIPSGRKRSLGKWCSQHEGTRQEHAQYIHGATRMWETGDRTLILTLSGVGNYERVLSEVCL